MSEEGSMTKVFDKEIIKNLLRISVFNKPLKNKLVLLRVSLQSLGSAALDKIDDHLVSIQSVVSQLIESDPKNFQDTQLLVTHDAVSIKAFDADKLRNKVTIFIIGSESYEPSKEDADEMRKVIHEAYKSLKIPVERAIISRHPLQTIKVESNA